MLGLWSAPKGDSSFSPSEAVYGSPLALPDEILDHPEFPLEVFLRPVKGAVSGFSEPPRHHMVSCPYPQPLPLALLVTEFFFVCDDTSKPLLALTYRDLYRVLQGSEQFFVLQNRDISDYVSGHQVETSDFFNSCDSCYFSNSRTASVGSRICSLAPRSCSSPEEAGLFLHSRSSYEAPPES